MVPWWLGLGLSGFYGNFYVGFCDCDGVFLCGFCWVSYGGVVVVPWGVWWLGLGLFSFLMEFSYVGFVIVMGFLM